MAALLRGARKGCSLRSFASCAFACAGWHVAVAASPQSLPSCNLGPTPAHKIIVGTLRAKMAAAAEVCRAMAKVF